MWNFLQTYHKLSGVKSISGLTFNLCGLRKSKNVSIQIIENEETFSHIFPMASSKIEDI